MVANVSIIDCTDPTNGIGVDPNDVVRSVSRAIAWAGGRASQSTRFDSGGSPVMPSRYALEAYHRHTDELALREFYSRTGNLPGGAIVQAWNRYRDSLDPEARRRVDAGGLSGGAGAHPRELEYIRAMAWEEQRQPLNAYRLFPIDRSVPLGARTHTAERLVGDGEAEIYRGGTVQVRARTSKKQESFGVLYVVSAVQTQFFDNLSTDWAGIRQYQNDLRLAYRLVDERVNEIYMNGDAPSNVAGILNYPHLATQTFGATISDATNPYTIVRLLNTVQYTPMIQSGGTFGPTRCVTSPRIRAFLASRKHDVTGSSDTTMLRYFLDNQDPSGGVQSIDAAQELQGIGPNGEDGILFYRDDLDSVGLVDIQPATALPVFQSSALEQITVVYAAIGGAVMGDVGNHILALAPVSGIG